MFINENYNNYKYIVEVSDNYIVLTNQRIVNADWQNPKEIDIIYQYIKPSTLVIEDVRTITNNRTYQEVDIQNDYWSRADSLEISRTSILILLLIIFFANGVTRIVKKGGIFFGN